MKRQYDSGPSGGGKRPVRCAILCGAGLVSFVQFNSACSGSVGNDLLVARLPVEISIVLMSVWYAAIIEATKQLWLAAMEFQVPTG